jgi:hypothetical protein
VLTVDELETCRAAGGGAACCRYGLGRGKLWAELFRDNDECEEWDEWEKPVDLCELEKPEALMKDRWRSS